MRALSLDAVDGPKGGSVKHSDWITKVALSAERPLDDVRPRSRTSNLVLGWVTTCNTHSPLTLWTQPQGLWSSEPVVS